MLKPGTEYYGMVTGTGTFKAKTGTEVPYLVWVGAAADNIACEYQICTWKLMSAKKFDPQQMRGLYISQKGKYFFCRPE